MKDIDTSRYTITESRRFCILKGGKIHAKRIKIA